MAKTNKRTITKAHKIGDKIKGKPGVRNPYAVGMAVAKKSAAKNRRNRKR